MADCSIIVPVYNQAAVTARCLDILLAESAASARREIIVVDDGSSDSVPHVLARYGDRIRVVTHGGNAGFATACNSGAAIAAGEYLVFLNNDTLPTDGWLDALTRYADEHPQVAVVGSKLLYPDETVQHAGVVIGHDRYPRHLYRGFPGDHPAVNQSRRFQAVTAACALVRRAEFEQVHGFDNAFFNEFEDVDLCLRMGLHGYETHFCHESVLYHLESVSRDSRQHVPNSQRYVERWGHRVLPDDIRYYVDDGLVQIHNDDAYPARLEVSPLLALVEGPAQERQMAQLLRQRSRQVFALLRETVRLSAYIGEVELRHAESGRGEPSRLYTPGRAQAATLGEIAHLSDRLDTIAIPANPAATPPVGGEEELRALLIDTHQQLLARDESIEETIYNLQVALAAAFRADPARRSALVTFAPSSQMGYRQTIREIRTVVDRVVPEEATVLVVSKGDDDLLALGQRRGWHFPQAENGEYAGYYPANSAAAITHLEYLAERGAEYLLLPNTSYWWLDYYREFHDHLEERYPAVVHGDETCIIYWLRASHAIEPQLAIRRDHDAAPQQLVRQIREIARNLLPSDATVVVASRGDDTLLDLGGPQGWHFPQTQTGSYAGHEPPSSAAATAHLEELREKGGEYFLIPSTSWGGVEQYVGFRRYLEHRYRVVTRQQHICVIYAL